MFFTHVVPQVLDVVKPGVTHFTRKSRIFCKNLNVIFKGTKFFEFLLTQAREQAVTLFRCIDAMDYPVGPLVWLMRL